MSALEYGASGHAKLPPSGASRWMKCPGSARLSAGIKGESSEAAEEGSAAHWLAYMILKAHKELRPVPEYVVGKSTLVRAGDTFLLNPKGSVIATNGRPSWVITQEMQDAVTVYTDFVLGLVADRGAQFYLERHIEVHPPQVHGSVDAIVYEPMKRVTIVDFKYGKGVSVEAKENAQMLCYAVGAMALDDAVEEFELVIIQPRDFHNSEAIRSWSLSAEDLESWRSGVLLPAIAAASAPDSILRAGSHCRWCAAELLCPEVKNATLAIAAQDFELCDVHDIEAVNPPAPEAIPDDKLSVVLNAASMIRNWLDAVEAHAQEKAEKGLKIPGYKLVHKKSNRKWVDEKAAAASLTPALGKGIWETKLKSVAEMEKVVKKSGKKVEDVMAGLWEKPDNGLTLVGENDKRNAVEPIQGDFQSVPGLEFLE